VDRYLEDDEASQGDPLSQDLTHHVTQSIRTFGEAFGVVLRDEAAHGHASPSVELWQHCVKDLAADALEVDIDSSRSCSPQLFAEVGRMMI
jgi:hypothetical protein